MNMNCRIWDETCDGYLCGDLDQVTLSAFLSHADQCPRCRSVLEALEIDLTVTEAGAPDLTDSILARTSGPACRRAEQLLADGLESLPDDERRLTAAHMEHCLSCRGLAEVLHWMLPALREMQEIQPGADLTYDILRASSAVRARKRAGLVMRSLDRFQVWWESQIRRPQFIWEAAFVGTMMLVLLFGTPISPARKAPNQALNVVQAGPARVQMISRELYNAAEARLGELREDLGSRKSRTGPDRADLKRHGLDVGGALLKADFEATGTGMSNMNEDIRDLWRKWQASEPDTADLNQEANR